MRVRDVVLVDGLFASFLASLALAVGRMAVDISRISASASLGNPLFMVIAAIAAVFIVLATFEYWKAAAGLLLNVALGVAVAGSAGYISVRALSTVGSIFAGF